MLRELSGTADLGWSFQISMGSSDLLEPPLNIIGHGNNTADPLVNVDRDDSVQPACDSLRLRGLHLPDSDEQHRGLFTDGRRYRPNWP
ncbi:MAG: hypothetical protein WAM60_22880 [Candidatus Promineifilaceae bacterium]